MAEGDVLLVGRYKFTVRLESKFTGFRIDEDITPDVNVTDPLELIENQVPERNHALEEPLRSLVEEFSGEPQIDSEDPLDLLAETSEHEDLIGRVEMTPDPDPFRSQMQLADDSNDVQAEMPMPIIPDDWFDSLSEPQSNVSDAARKYSTKQGAVRRALLQ
ncbi:hypothetical protein JCM19233_2609 [Vibrio astriarenae]|nr:hypothetical protein JCM19233_2609 [Vibrio sp. C7]